MLLLFVCFWFFLSAYSIAYSCRFVNKKAKYSVYFSVSYKKQPAVIELLTAGICDYANSTLIPCSSVVTVTDFSAALLSIIS